jgi:hypothetical protein
MTTLGVAMTILLQVLAAVLLADFLSGLFHWFEDSWFEEDTPLVGGVIRLNELHHRKPRAFLAKAWYVNIRSSVVLAIALGSVLALVGALTPFVAGVLVLASLGNLTHAWAHLPEPQRSRLLCLAHRSGVLITPAHHVRHHLRRKDSHYCTMTNLVNPVLDRVGFWRGLERLVRLATGRRPRPQRQALAARPVARAA